MCRWSVRVIDLSALSSIIIIAASPVNLAAQEGELPVCSADDTGSQFR